MKKRIMATALAALTACSCMGVLSACGDKGASEGTLTIRYYNGGYGDEWLEEALKDFKYLDQLEIYDSGFALHVTDKRVNKGSSLRYLCERNGINMENVMAIGDSENDLDMIDAAGIGIVMGQAREEIRRHADRITASVEEDGAALAIEQLIREESK